MLLIVVEHEKKEAVLGAIKEVKCLKEPGMGIAFKCVYHLGYILEENLGPRNFKFFFMPWKNDN